MNPNNICVYMIYWLYQMSNDESSIGLQWKKIAGKKDRFYCTWMALVVSIYFRIWSEHPHKQRESIRWSRCVLDIVWATRFRHFYPCNQYTGIAQVVHVRYIKEDTESLTRIFFVCSCSCSPFHPTWHHDRRWYVVFRGLETSWLQ